MIRALINVAAAAVIITAVVVYTTTIIHGLADTCSRPGARAVTPECETYNVRGK